MDISTVLLKNRYRVGEIIGQGGMASVHRGFDTSLGRDVAIKIFAASDVEIEVVQQEAEVNVLASLGHHSLVTLFDAGVDRSDRNQPRIFLVMELIRGSDLQRTIAERTITGRDIAYMGYDIAEALQYIHGNGIVHRDIKPSNILLADYRVEAARPRALLTDFGIAHRGVLAQSPNDPSTTGTAAYLSPEQVLRAEVGSAADVYSLGLVLIESFTGTLAFPGDPRDAALARLDTAPHIPESIGADWRTLLTAMTDLDPAQRPNATELVLAFRDLIIAETGRHKNVSADDEARRLEAVGSHHLADVPPDPAFDRITAMAARVLETPVALLSIVGQDTIWFTSKQGVDLDSVARVPGLCSSAIEHDKPWIVHDARNDPRTVEHPLVTGDFGLQFYAGYPVRTSDGHAVGTLCVIDFVPRTLTAAEVETLHDLAAMAEGEIAIRAPRVARQLQ